MLNYLQSNGLDVYGLVNKLHDFLDLPPLIQALRKHVARRGVGVRGLLDDIEALLPLEKIKALYEDKLMSSPDFAALIEHLKSDEMKAMVQAINKNPAIQDINKRLKEQGVDVALVIDLLNKIFGWGIEGRTAAVTFNLKDDMNDFMALIPVDEIVNVALDYLFNDEEVQEVLEYLQSDESVTLIQEVESVPEFAKVGQEVPNIQTYDMCMLFL